jgi:hypothetical protein
VDARPIVEHEGERSGEDEFGRDNDALRKSMRQAGQVPVPEKWEGSTGHVGRHKSFGRNKKPRRRAGAYRFDFFASF